MFSLICTKIVLLSPSFEIFSEILVYVCYAKATFLQDYIDNQTLVCLENLRSIGFNAPLSLHCLDI